MRSLAFTEPRQTRNKQEMISDDNETMQITETERPDKKGLDDSFRFERSKKATLRRWHLRWDPNDKMEPAKTNVPYTYSGQGSI